MVKLLNQILDLIRSFLSFKIKKEEQKIKEQEQEKKQKKSIDEQKQDAANAVFNGDVDTVNKIVNTVIVICIVLLSGCASTKIIYVPSDRQVKKIVYEDVDGYFVPNVVMSELLQYKVEAKYYKEKYEQFKYQEDSDK